MDFPTVPNGRSPVQVTPAAVDDLKRAGAVVQAPNAGGPGGQYYSGQRAAGVFANFDKAAEYQPDRGLAPIDHAGQRLDENPQFMTKRQRLFASAAAQGGVQAPHGFSAPANQSPYSDAAMMKLAHSRAAKKLKARGG
jgi:hypothetical protein